MHAEGLQLPAPQGRLFDVRLQLQGDLQAGMQRLTGSKFLGGVLHGAVGSRWFELAGPPAHDRIGAQRNDELSAALSWRILAPPHGPADVHAQGGTSGVLQSMQFGVLLHGGHCGLWDEAQQAIDSLTELGVGAWRLPVLSVHCRHRALPTTPASPVLDSAHVPDEPVPPATLALHWCTPLHMTSRSKVQAGYGISPPPLLAVVRSLRRRACLLEPAWAKALGLNTEAWVWAEEAMRQATTAGNGAARSRMRVETWRYGSRTKNAPFARYGLVGCQAFRAPFPASMLALLSLGAWLGAGEGASFGCGQFRWRVRLPSGNRVPALLPQPWSGMKGELLD